jgi:hypothetical protein
MATLNNTTYTQQFHRDVLTKLLSVSNVMTKESQTTLKSLYSASRGGNVIVAAAKRTYSLSKSKIGQMGYGRYYSNHGLETVLREARGSLCMGLYTDIDIVNAHYVLFEQYAKRHFNINLPAFAKYNKNRDALFAEMMEREGIDRDECKQIALKMMYERENQTRTLFAEMAAEVQLVYDLMKQEEIHKELYDHHVRQKTANIRGSFLANIMQTEERKCLEAMVASFTADGLQVDVLCYDGCMVRGDNVVSEQHLRNAEAAIRERTGYEIELKIKPLETFNDLDSASNTTNDAWTQQYEDMRAKWELNHFYYEPADTWCHVADSGKIKQYTLLHAYNAFNTEEWILPPKPGASEPVQFFREWCKSPKRRTVNDMVYKMPEDCEANEVSLFGGFGYQKITEEYTPEQAAEAIALFNDILSVLCNAEAPVMDYVGKTIAHMLQKPFERTGVMTVITSQIQGIGKDTLMLIIEEIIGKHHTAHYTSTEAYWDKHDTKQEGAIFVYLEEANSSINKAKSNELKARITSNSININPKGLKSYTVPNVARNFMTTNEPEPVKIEESDRRVMLITCTTPAPERDWCAVYETLFSKTSIRALGEYFAAMDISGWNPRRFPETAIKREMRELGKTTEAMFLDQWQPTEWVSGATMFQEYVDFCKSEGLPHAMNSLSFLRKIVSLRDQKYQSRRLRANKQVYGSMTMQYELVDE